MVRFDYIKKLGYYCTESSEHNAEYNPFSIKSLYPEIIKNVIMESMLSGVPYKIGGNVLNKGNIIENLPKETCVEVPCLADKNSAIRKLAPSCV
jgi:alpha-galactosidase